MHVRAALGLLLLMVVGCSAEGPSERVDATFTEVVGTEDTGLGFSGVVGVLTRKGDFVARCTGVLVAPDLMLTARHCIALDDGGSVVCGMPSLGASVAPEEVLVTAFPEISDVRSDYVAAREIIVAPGGDDTCGFDLAAVRLTLPPPGATAVYAPRLDAPVVEGEAFSSVGYGSDGNGGTGVRRYQDNAQVVCAGNGCSAPDVQENEWMASSEAFCEGDSGAPALDGQARLIGTVSRGQSPCMSPILTAMPAWKDWLVEVAGQGDPVPDWASATGAPTPEPEPGSEQLESTCAFSEPRTGRADIVLLCTLAFSARRRKIGRAFKIRR